MVVDLMRYHRRSHRHDAPTPITATPRHRERSDGTGQNSAIMEGGERDVLDAETHSSFLNAIAI
jgi:hypothetical protein